MLMTKILEILTEAADFLSLESLVYTIPPYGEWNTCIVVFTLFHWAYCIGLEQTAVKQNTGTPGMPLLCSSVIHPNHGKCLTVQLDCCHYDDVTKHNSAKKD